LTECLVNMCRWWVGYCPTDPKIVLYEVGGDNHALYGKDVCINSFNPDLSRRHHLLSRADDKGCPCTFSQKLRFGWESIWRRLVHINHMNNVSSKYFCQVEQTPPTKIKNDNTGSNSFNSRLEQVTSVEQTTFVEQTSRRHHLPIFSQKLRCGWGNIWRKFVNFNHMNNVSSNLFQNILSSWSDDTRRNVSTGINSTPDLSRQDHLLSRWHHLPTFSQ
jgi:hypothetical protein